MIVGATVTLLACILIFGAGCGGASSQDLNFDQILATAQKYLRIDSNDMRAFLYFWNEDEASSLVLVIPLRHYFAGEVIELGSDNAFSRNDDQAALFVYQYAETDINTPGSFGNADPEPIGAWVSTEGQVTIDEASVQVNNGLLMVRIADAQMRSIDLSSNMIDREGEATSYSMTAFKSVDEGAINEPFIVDAASLSGGIGNVVHMRGFNLAGDTKVRFQGCANFELPVAMTSDTAFDVTISAFCKDSTFVIESDGYYSTGLAPVFVFDQEMRAVVQPLPNPQEDLLKVVHDPATDQIYMLFKPGNEIDVYSPDDKGFLASKTLPFAAETFDVAPDGTLMISKEKQLAIVTADGSIQAQTMIPQGVRVSDMVSGPAQKVLIVNDYQDYWKLPDVCIWDRSTMVVTCPAELKLQNKTAEPPVAITRNDRQLIMIASSDDGPYGALYRFESNDTIQKVHEGILGYFDTLLLHPLRDEMWIDGDVINPDFSSVRSLMSWNAYPSNVSGRCYILQGCDIGIYTDDEAGRLLSYTSCSDDLDTYGYGPPKTVFPSDDDRYVTFIWDDNIRQIDLILINAYLSGQ